MERTQQQCGKKFGHSNGAKHQNHYYFRALKVQEKAEIFSEYFGNIFRNNSSSTLSDSTINKLNEETSIDTITREELEENIRTLNKKGSPGMDQVTNKMLTNLPNSGLMFS